jgi:hypothetical protein
LVLGGNDYEDETQFQVCQCTWQRLSQFYKHMCPLRVQVGLSFFSVYDTMGYPLVCYVHKTPTTQCSALNDIIST